MTGIALWACVISTYASKSSVVVATDGSTESIGFRSGVDESSTSTRKESRQVRSDGAITNVADKETDSVDATTLSTEYLSTQGAVLKSGEDGAVTSIAKEQRQVRADEVVGKETEAASTGEDSPADIIPSDLLEGNMSFAAERYALSAYMNSLGVSEEDTHSALVSEFGLGSPFKFPSGSTVMSEAPEGTGGVLLEVASSETEGTETARLESEEEMEGRVRPIRDTGRKEPKEEKPPPPRLKVEAPNSEELKEAMETPTQRMAPGGVDHPTMHSHKRLMEHLTTVIQNARTHVLDESIIDQFKKRLLITQKKDAFTNDINRLQKEAVKERLRVKHAQQAALLGLLRFGETTDVEDLETTDVAFDRWKTFLGSVSKKKRQITDLREQIHQLDDETVATDRETTDLFHNMDANTAEIKREAASASTRITALKQFSELKYSPAIGKVPAQADGTA